MKHLFLFLSLFFLVSNDVSAQIYNGPAIEFQHDAAGNRVLRKYNASATIVYKQGNNSENPVDTSIQHIVESKLVIQAYPNPVDDYITVENLTWVDGKTATIKLFDITGKLISTKVTKSSKENIPFSVVTPGIYQLHYYLNNQLVTNWKVVKK